MKFCSKKGKKRKLTKRKILNGVRGSISIFLCLLLTPFLSISLALIEYARYQEAIELTNEVYELSGISVLSDYDPYIHSRFGLLATAQEVDLEEGAEGVLTENIQVLGKQVTLENTKFSGKFPLKNNEVLKRQVVDFSELTSTTAVLLDDFHLQELLDKLDGLSKFQEVADTMDSLVEATEALSEAVEALEGLTGSLQELGSSVRGVISSATTLANDMANLYKRIGEDGIMLPKNATPEEVDLAVTSFQESYLEDFKELYATATELKENLSSIKPNLEEVKTSVTDFQEAVETARGKIQGIVSSSNTDLSQESESEETENEESEREESNSTEEIVDAQGEESGETESDGVLEKEPSVDDKIDITTKVLEDTFEEMDTLFTDTLSSIKEDSINEIREAVDEIITSSFETCGFSEEIFEKYSSIMRGNYLETESGKEDIVEFLKTAYKIYVGRENPSTLIGYFKSKFVPEIKIDINGISQIVSDTLQEVTDSLLEHVGDKLMKFLTDLVNTIKELFDLDLFYEASMTAYVNIDGAVNNPYQKFLDAVGDLFEAIEEFSGTSGEANTSGKAKNALKGMTGMFQAVGNLMKSIIEIANDSLSNIAGLVASTATGDVRDLYERLLISGYMRHNLPCRVDAGDFSMGLEGEGLTGFAFDEIPRPAILESGDFISGNLGISKFQALSQTLENLKKGHGEDSMFQGAELEYIRVGTNSEVANQIVCFFDIYFLRMILDLPSIFTDTEVSSVAAVANVAAWVVYILYIIAEPFCDTVLLVNGATVPLLKGDCWLTATKVSKFVEKLGEVTLGEDLQRALSQYSCTFENFKKSDTSSIETNLGEVESETVDSKTTQGFVEVTSEYQTDEYNLVNHKKRMGKLLEELEEKKEEKQKVDLSKKEKDKEKEEETKEEKEKVDLSKDEEKEKVDLSKDKEKEKVDLSKDEEKKKVDLSKDKEKEKVDLSKDEEKKKVDLSKDEEEKKEKDEKDKEKKEKDKEDKEKDEEKKDADDSTKKKIGVDFDMDYRTHMLILLLLHVSPDDQIKRLKQLINLECTEYYAQQEVEFNLGKTYTVVKIKADATFHPFFDLGTYTGGEALLPKFSVTQSVSY